MFRKNSVMIKWFISYICIMALVLSIMIANFNIMKSDLEEKITYSHQNMLGLLQNSMDNSFDLQERLYLQLALNSEVEKVMRSNGSDAAMNYRVLQQIKSMIFSNQSIEDVIVCFYNQGITISKMGVSDCRTMHDLIFENSDYEQWISSMRKNYTGERVIIDGYRAGQTVSKQIAYIKSVPFTGSTDAARATVMVLVSEEFFYKQAGNFSNGGSLVKLMDEEGTTLLQTDNTEVDDGGENVVRYDIGSNINTWRYCTFTPKRVYWKEIDSAWLILVIMVALAIVLGIAMSMLMLKFNYKPITGLLKHVSEIGVKMPNKGHDEFNYIKSVIQSTIEERDRIIETQKSQLVQNSLSRLVKNDGGKIIKEDYEKLNISSPSDHFMIVLFYLENPQKLFAEDDVNDMQRRHLLSLVISNIMSEVVFPYGESYFFDVDIFFASLVSIKSELTTEKEIMKALDEGSRAIEEHFDIALDIMISNIHKGIESLPISYQEAYDTWEYKELLGKNGIYLYSDIDVRESMSYYYPANKENQLINVMRSGDKEEMLRILEEIFYENIEKNACSLNFFKYLLVDIMSTVLKLSAEIKNGDKEMFNKEDINSLFDVSSVNAGKEKVINFAIAVCDKIKESIDAGKRNVGQEVKKYISVHYKEQTLNIQQIGDVFKIKPYYLSKQFKKETGEGLINYIHRYRVERAKELIRETNLKMEDVARKVGFLDAKTLIRSFKTVEGITPGAFKEISYHRESVDTPNEN